MNDYLSAFEDLRKHRPKHESSSSSTSSHILLVDRSVEMGDRCPLSLSKTIARSFANVLSQSILLYACYDRLPTPLFISVSSALLLGFPYVIFTAISNPIMAMHKSPESYSFVYFHKERPYFNTDRSNLSQSALSLLLAFSSLGETVAYTVLFYHLIYHELELKFVPSLLLSILYSSSHFLNSIEKNAACFFSYYIKTHTTNIDTEAKSPPIISTAANIIFVSGFQLLRHRINYSLIHTLSYLTLSSIIPYTLIKKNNSDHFFSHAFSLGFFIAIFLFSRQSRIQENKYDKDKNPYLLFLKFLSEGGYVPKLICKSTKTASSQSKKMTLTLHALSLTLSLSLIPICFFLHKKNTHQWVKTTLYTSVFFLIPLNLVSITSISRPSQRIVNTLVQHAESALSTSLIASFFISFYVNRLFSIESSTGLLVFLPILAIITTLSGLITAPVDRILSSHILFNRYLNHGHTPFSLDIASCNDPLETSINTRIN